MSTIELEIDKLGRIVIPAKFRKKLGLQKEEKNFDFFRERFFDY